MYASKTQSLSTLPITTIYSRVKHEQNVNFTLIRVQTTTIIECLRHAPKKSLKYSVKYLYNYKNKIYLFIFING